MHIALAATLFTRLNILITFFKSICDLSISLEETQTMPCSLWRGWGQKLLCCVYTCSCVHVTLCFLVAFHHGSSLYQEVWTVPLHRQQAFQRGTQSAGGREGGGTQRPWRQPQPYSVQKGTCACWHSTLAVNTHVCDMNVFLSGCTYNPVFYIRRVHTNIYKVTQAALYIAFCNKTIKCTFLETEHNQWHKFIDINSLIKWLKVIYNPAFFYKKGSYKFITVTQAALLTVFCSN